MADLIVMSEMTWAEVDEAMKDRPVGILPVGAIEAHGPHLPLNADTVIAIEIANIHLDPGHIECLKAALEEAKKAGASVCWADITKKRWADLLGETFAKGDHAGAFETSLMMAAAPG